VVQHLAAQLMKFLIGSNSEVLDIDVRNDRLLPPTEDLDPLALKHFKNRLYTYS
jgi:hypothetical protein